MNYKVKAALTLFAALIGFSLFCSTMAVAQGEGQQCSGNPNQLISYGNVILCSIQQEGSSGTFEFNGNAGDRVEVEVVSSAYWPCVELVGVTTACGAGNRNWIDTVLSTTKQYTIRVYGYSYNNVGNYTFDLESVVPHSPNARQTRYGLNLSDQINPFGDLDTFFFTASAGDVVDITVASGDYWPCITLYAPDAKTTWNACGAGNRNEMRTPALTMAGTYTILHYGYGYNNTGSYNVDVECLAGPCIQVQIPALAGYLMLRGAPLANQLVGIVSPNPGGGQTTTTDPNGYYQFLTVPSGTFTVYAPISAQDNSASAESVQESEPH